MPKPFPSPRLGEELGMRADQGIPTGKVTVKLERGYSIVIIKEVPAQVCDNCGEYTTRM